MDSRTNAEIISKQMLTRYPKKCSHHTRTNVDIILQINADIILQTNVDIIPLTNADIVSKQMLK
jgi:hypothetical protein